MLVGAAQPPQQTILAEVSNVSGVAILQGCLLLSRDWPRERWSVRGRAASRPGAGPRCRHAAPTGPCRGWEGGLDPGGRDGRSPVPEAGGTGAEAVGYAHCAARRSDAANGLDRRGSAVGRGASGDRPPGRSARRRRAESPTANTVGAGVFPGGSKGGRTLAVVTLPCRRWSGRDSVGGCYWFARQAPCWIGLQVGERVDLGPQWIGRHRGSLLRSEARRA